MCCPRFCARLRPRPCGWDKIALHVGKAAKHSDHQAPGAGAGIGSRLGKRAKLRVGVHYLLDDGEQVEGAAREAVRCSSTSLPVTW